MSESESESAMKMLSLVAKMVMTMTMTTRVVMSGDEWWWVVMSDDDIQYDVCLIIENFWTNKRWTNELINQVLSTFIKNWFEFDPRVYIHFSWKKMELNSFSNYNFNLDFILVVRV